MTDIFNTALQNIMEIVYVLPALLISITFHELAHGYTAYKLGDPTAKDMGRLTLNPIKHIDPIGFIALLILRFGWAKPVPYNPNYFEKRKQGTFLVAIAGPLTNILLALISIILIMILKPDNITIYSFLENLFYFNVIFAIFNLLPVPPLDGSKLIASILPEKMETYFWKYEKYGYGVLLLLMVTDVIGYILNPAINITISALITIGRLFY
ncbi:MAG: site-2 protease family protein [Eubacteriaceae bacterium]